MERKLLIAALIVGVVGCAHRSQDAAAPAPAPAPAAAPAPAPAPAKAAAPPAGKAWPGMNERGEVIDAHAVEQGHGQQIKGLNGYDGEILGIPAPGTRFGKLQIGMPMRQVVDLIGQPSDAGAYITGKAFIPFYFGSDRHRVEFVYKGQGRLIFAGGGGWGGYGEYGSGGYLIWIIHSAREPGSR